MMSDSLWINGPSRSGKTNRLVQQFCRWVSSEVSPKELLHTQNPRPKNRETIPKQLYLHQTAPAVLVLAANDDNRRELANRIVNTTQGQYPIRGKTPLGFFQDEVILFWPLLIQSLKLKAQFPVRLRPETEQELATKLWRSQLSEEILHTRAEKSVEFAEESANGGIRPRLATTVSEYRLVRRILDLLQLAAYSGTMTEDIASILERGLGEEGSFLGLGELKPEFLASLLLDWRNWCLERGLLTYGIVTELYSQHLLPNPNYQQQLAKRYQAVLADDVQDYPAVARHLLESLLQGGAVGAFSYNPDSTVRLGLGADPDYMSRLRLHCRVETLNQPFGDCLAETIATPMLELIAQPIILSSLPQSVQSIQTISRAQLLRQTAEVIVRAIKLQQVQPNEVAIIAPGLDAIARYTIMEILSKQNILVESLNDQRPLISSPVIRGLLTMLALIYPGLGRLVDRDAVAEMLVVLSRGEGEFESSGVREFESSSSISASPYPRVPISYATIDPVRAGLIADYCFVPHPERPNLLPVTAFERWDRLGYGATTAYAEILQWIDKQRSQQEMHLIPSPISLLDRAIQHFLWNGSNLPYHQLAALRELLETAQHYWEIDTRLRQTHSAYHQWNSLVEAEDAVNSSENLSPSSPQNTIAEFIQLLRRGTITANAYPVRSVGAVSKAVTLATIFQYRSSRQFHRWHFWLDAGSPLWAKGGAAALFGASFFLQERLGQPWTAEDEKLAEEQRLQNILADLLSRVSEQIYLCHSDLAVNGQEQLGSLLPLVNACVPSQE